MDLKELLKKFHDAGIMAEATLEEKYSFEQTLADNSEALQLQQTDVVGRSEQLCDFEHHNADIRRAYTCSECGGRKLK